MKLKSMTATFGSLSARRLELSDGLNLIHAPNEGGKSTWAAFLKAMLYGIDTRDRDRKGYLADKNRYQPWSGAPMEGELTLEWRGRDVTIRRGPKGTTPFGAFSAVYTGTSEPVPALTADNCGQTLLGVEREVYERSAFIGGGTLAVTAAPELEKRIAALASSGEEDVSCAQAEGRLREWRNRRRVNRSVGRIPELEQELAGLDDTLERLSGAAEEAARADGALKRLDAQRAELEGELELHRRLARRELNVRTARAKGNLADAQAKLDALTAEQSRFGALPARDELKRAQEQLQYLKGLSEDVKRMEQGVEGARADFERENAALPDGRFSGLTGEEARHRAGEAAAAFQTAEARAKDFKRRFILLQLWGAIALAAMIALDQALNGGPKLFFWLGLAGYAAALTSAFLCLRRAKAERAGAAELLLRWDVRDAGELAPLAEEYAVRRRTLDEAALRLNTARNAWEDGKARLENGRADLFDFVRSFAPEVRDLFGCSAALSRALTLDEQLLQAQREVLQARSHADDLAAQGGTEFDTLEALAPPARGRQVCEETLAELTRRQQEERRARDVALGRVGELGDPDILAAKREELARELARRGAEYDALTVALEVLSAANARLSERFSPALNRLAGEYMTCLTGGKYGAVSLTRELEGAAAREGDVLAHSALYLSRGTVDQLYLAVRLAVCRLCLPEEERPPVVLDDALTAFDDARMLLALELLTRLGREEQLLLFTCQRREGEALKGRADVRVLEL